MPREWQRARSRRRARLAPRRSPKSLRARPCDPDRCRRSSPAPRAARSRCTAMRLSCPARARTWCQLLLSPLSFPFVVVPLNFCTQGASRVAGPQSLRRPIFGRMGQSIGRSVGGAALWHMIVDDLNGWADNFPPPVGKQTQEGRSTPCLQHRFNLTKRCPLGGREASSSS